MFHEKKHEQISISVAIFNSYVGWPEGDACYNLDSQGPQSRTTAGTGMDAEIQRAELRDPILD